MTTGSSLKIIAIGSALGCLLAVSSARAQDNSPYGPPPGYQDNSPYGPPANYQNNGPYGPPPGYEDANENVEVTAPRIHTDRTQRLNGPLEKISMSTAVPYSDLDLRTREGARELRHRVRDAAWNICMQLADAYPVYQANGTSCYRSAYENGMVRANSAINAVRVAYRQSYYDY